jgi:hypothetical protein
VPLQTEFLRDRICLLRRSITCIYRQLGIQVQLLI